MLAPSELGPQNIHVWCVRTDTQGDIAGRFERLLVPEERAQAARFRFDHLKRSYVVGHGVLRILLGRYVSTPPQNVQFIYGARGKPALPAPAQLHFNMSHSGAIAVLAFTKNCEIGIDVEQIRPVPEMEAVAKRFFCPEETAELMALNPSQRELAFFLCWTRKEAYLKAIGDGLAAPLNGFRVTLRPTEPARMVHLTGDVTAATAWTLSNLELVSSYASAVAYRDVYRPVEAVSLDASELLAR